MTRRPRFQVSLRTMLAEMLLAGVAMGITRLLFSVNERPARIVAHGVLLAWLLVAGSLVFSGWRSLSGWGCFTSALFIVVGNLHAAAPLVFWICWTLRAEPAKLLRIETSLLLVAGLLFIAAEFGRSTRTKAWLGLTALVLLAAVVAMLAANPYGDPYKTVSLLPVILFAVIRGWIDVTAITAPPTSPRDRRTAAD